MSLTLLSTIAKFDKQAELSLEWYNVFVPDAGGKPRVAGHVQGTWVVEAEKNAKQKFGADAFVRVVDKDDGKLPLGTEFGKRPTALGIVTVKFRPGEVEGMVAEALNFLPGKPPRFHHDPAGSKIEFHSAQQLQSYIEILRDYASDAEMANDPEMKKAQDGVKNTIKHITSQMPQAANDGNLALASTHKFDKQAATWQSYPGELEYVPEDDQSDEPWSEEELAHEDEMMGAPPRQDLRHLAPKATPFHVWLKAVEQISPEPGMDYHNPSARDSWKRKYDKGLTPQQANDEAFPMDDFDSNPVLASIRKFDKKADYKVKPFIEPSDKESKELKAYKDDDYPRVGSDSLKIIEHLYNVKHECYEYKSNIMEDAHPEKKVIMQSYDKMNGLLENDIERQKINLNIMRKPVSGLEYRQKYADLLRSLLKTANDMDFQKHESLYKLADSTIESLQKEALDLGDIKRWFGDKSETVTDIAGGSGVGTIAGGLIGALLGGGLPGAYTGARLGGVLGGVVSAIVKTGPTAKNVQQNAKAAESAINALLKEHHSDIFLSTLATELTHIQDTAAKYSNLTSQMQAHTNSIDSNQVMQVGQEYIAEINKLDTDIDTFLSNAKEGKYAPEESDWLSKVKSPFQAVFGDAVNDAVEAMSQLERVSEAAIDGIQHAKDQAQSLSVSGAEPGEGEVAELQKLLQGK